MARGPRLTDDATTHDSPPRSGETVISPADLAVGERIDRYKIREVIGEGGFATVYLAAQSEPVARQVALKIIKLGMDTKEVLARFEAERQALAMMDHPHVAKVFDAGMTDKGRPYFVMEHVAGDAITEYCDRNRLPLAERLELFMQACAAVQHAHQKGIIHRDIKPTNVLVTAKSGKPTVKVIDFGVAKALHGRLTDSTVHTMHGQFIGTPEYMSPEQAEMTGVDVDTRTDVYSLGVLLYELLTGETPFQPQLKQTGSPADIQRIIREEDPPRPSTRLSTMGDRLSEIARQRRMEIRPLTRRMKGELDWIVMKTLEKDRTRRYETANGLAMDVQRYLADEPVMAGPPSTSYRVRKFLHRNRVAVAAGSVVTLALVAGLTLAIIFAARENQAREAAEAAHTRAMENQEQLEASERMLRELYQRYGHLSMAIIPLENVSGAPDQDAFAVGMTDALYDALSGIKSLHLKSLDAARYIRKLQPDASPSAYAREMQVDLILEGNAMRAGDVVQVNVWLTHGADAQRFWGKMYEGRWTNLGALERDVLGDVARAVMLEMPDDAPRLVDGRARNPQAREAYSKGLLKLNAPDQEDLDKAIEFFTEAIVLDPEYAQAFAARAKAYHAMLLTGARTPGEFMPSAEADARRAIELDPSLGDAWTVLGFVLLHYRWDWEAAEAAFQNGLEANPNSAVPHLGLAAYSVTTGDFIGAIEHLRRAAQLEPATLLIYDEFLYVPFNARQFDQVIEFAEQALELDDDYWATHAWYGLALAYADRVDEAIVAVNESVRLQDDLPMARVLQATVYAIAGRDDEAERMLDELVNMNEAQARYTCPYEIATVFVALGQPDKALEYLNDALAYHSECMPFLGTDVRMDSLRDHPEYQRIMDDVGVVYRGPEPPADDR